MYRTISLHDYLYGRLWKPRLHVDAIDWFENSCRRDYVYLVREAIEDLTNTRSVFGACGGYVRS